MLCLVAGALVTPSAGQLMVLQSRSERLLVNWVIKSPLCWVCSIGYGKNGQISSSKDAEKQHCYTIEDPRDAPTTPLWFTAKTQQDQNH